MPEKTAPPVLESVHPASSFPASNCLQDIHAYDQWSVSAPAASPTSGQKNAKSVPAEESDRRKLVPGQSVQTTAIGCRWRRERAPVWKRKNDRNCFYSRLHLYI